MRHVGPASGYHVQYDLARKHHETSIAATVTCQNDSMENKSETHHT